MNLPSNSGQETWNEFILYGCGLLNNQEKIYCYNGSSTEGTFESMLEDQQLLIPLSNGFSRQTLIRIAFGRIYYGILQQLINKFQINRQDYKNSIHRLVKETLREKNQWRIHKYFGKLYGYRIWADYRTESYDAHYGKPFDQILKKHIKNIKRLLTLLDDE